MTTLVFAYVNGRVDEAWQRAEIARWSAGVGPMLELQVTIVGEDNAVLPDGDPGVGWSRCVIAAKHSPGQDHAVLVAHPAVLGDVIGQEWADAYATREKVPVIWLHKRDEWETRDYVRQVIDRQNANELRRRMESARQGREKTRANGPFIRHPNQTPYGYRLDPTEGQVPDLAVQALIAQALTLRDEHGVGLAAIGEFWLQAGFRPRPPRGTRGPAAAANPNQAWTTKSVHDIVKKWRELVPPAPLGELARLFV